MTRSRLLPDLALIALCLLAAAPLAGCNGQSGSESQAVAQTPSKQESAQTAADKAPSGENRADRREYWDVIYLGDAKAGYCKTSTQPIPKSETPFPDAKGPLIRVESESRLSVLRFKEKSELQTRAMSIESPEGAVFGFAADSPVSGKISGHVQGDKLIITGPKGSTNVPWSADMKGYFGDGQSLERQPMLPGQTRKIKQLVAEVNRVADVELKARDYEKTDTLSGPQTLLRIDETIRFSAAGSTPMEQTAWVDKQGQLVKTQMGEMKSYRTTREVALAPAKGPKLDLGQDVIVKVDPPLASADRAKEVVYRVTLKDGDPAKVFVSGATQSVKSLGPHAAEITVRSVRRASDALKHDDDAPTDSDRQPNDMIQSDDALILKMAKQAAPDMNDPLALAFALEKYVRSAITKPDYSKAFASAAEVARTRQGDCTEHAVLLAALARARGIPARVAMGLAYLPSANGFAYHMWTEVYVDKVWLPLDGTRAQGGIPADHILMTHTNLTGPEAITSLVPVMQLLNQLKIEVLSSKTN